jgi:hypothetical protein
MIIRSQGMLLTFEALPAGAFFAFAANERTQYGLKVADSEGKAGGVCFTESPQIGRKTPAHFEGAGFANSLALHFPMAELRPDLSRENVHEGVPDFSQIGSLLIFSGGQILLRVSHASGHLDVDMGTGNLARREGRACFWVSRWSIVEPAEEKGKERLLFEFSSAPLR